MTKERIIISIMCILTCITGCSKTTQNLTRTEKIEWGYAAENGPNVWGQLSPEYSLCAEGKHQSPIDLVNPTPAELPPIRYNYDAVTNVAIRNNGHTIEVSYPEGSWIDIDGVRYELLQFHFHAPSEHTVAGEFFDMEMHLVHKRDNGGLAVVGVLIEKGKHNSELESVWAHLPETAGETRNVEDVTIDLPLMVSPTGTPQTVSEYYRYDGSLTTPPCSEGVQWIVLTTPIEMSAAQIAAFKAIIHDNNRPVQPLNGRELFINLQHNL